MRGDQQLIRQCLMIQDKQTISKLSLDQLDQREPKRYGEPAKKTIFVPLKEEDSMKTIQIGNLLYKEMRAQLGDFL